MSNIVKYLLLGLFCSSLLVGSLSAQDIGENKKRPRVGLVLSGGGARGLAHVGILKYLEEQRIKIDYIAGTSAGGIVAGLYASGLSAAEIEKQMVELDWNDVLKDNTARADRSMRRKQDDLLFSIKSMNGLNNFKISTPPGFISGQKIKLFLDRLTNPVAGITDFDKFAIPYRAIATDIVTGEEVVLKQGSLSQAMQATMSVPGVFAPVKFGDQYLVDGGLTNNSPVDAVRKMGADIVILVDISTPLLKKEELNGLLSITSQLTGFLTERNNTKSVKSLGPGDLLIRPELGEYSSSDFVKVREIIDLGYDEVTHLDLDMEKFSVDERSFRAYRQKLAKQRVPEYVIGYIELDNQSDLSDEVIESFLDLGTGNTFDEPLLRKHISDLYGLGFFEKIDYEIIPGAQTGLRITVKGKSWGPGYLNYGLSFRGGSGVINNLFDITVGYTRTLVNSRAGEWRSLIVLGSEKLLATDFYQPLDSRLGYFVRPSLNYSTRKYYLFEKGAPQTEYEVRQYLGGVELGYEFRQLGQISLHASRASGKLVGIVGEIPGGNSNFAENIFGARFVYDRIDQVYFPSKGAFFRLGYDNIRPDIGDTFGQVKLDYAQAGSLGKHTLIGRLRYDTSLEDMDAPQNYFRGGGFLNLSGYSENELLGENYAMMMGIYTYSPNMTSLVPVYLGASLEYGNTWNRSDNFGFGDMVPAGSVFVGADTPIGPFYLALGYASGGKSALYVYFGKSLFN